MGTKDMRTKHDTIPDWVYGDDKHGVPFTRGTIRMDKSDILNAMLMFYEEAGWDKETGSPPPGKPIAGWGSRRLQWNWAKKGCSHDGSR